MLLEKLENKISKLNSHIRASLSLFCASVLFVCVITSSTLLFKNLRMDLTDEGLFSVSNATKDVLNSIDEPITMHFYFSSLLRDISPTYASYATRITELLEHYVLLSNSKLKLNIYDPEPFSKEEDRAISFGLKGIPAIDGQTNVYFGLAMTNRAEGVKKIPLFDPQREKYLEYELTKLISDLNRAQRKKIGIITELPVDGVGNLESVVPEEVIPRWAFMKKVRSLFDVRFLSKHTIEIPDDIDVLMVINPKNLIRLTQYTIDQYVMRGGRVIIFLDPLSEAEAVYRDGIPVAGPKIDELLEGWGINYISQKIVGDMSLARPVSINKGKKSRVVNYLPWQSLTKKHLNQNDIITDSLEVINLASPGALELKKDSKTIAKPLLHSSKKSMLIDDGLIKVKPDPESLIKDFIPSNKEFVYAYRITGLEKSAFEKPPLQIFSKPSKHPFLKTPKGAVNAIIVADTDLLYDPFWAKQKIVLGERQTTAFADNGDFVINALDNLSGSEALIKLRTRGNWKRPFELIEKLQSKSQEKYQDKEKKLSSLLNISQGKLIKLLEKVDKNTDSVLSKEEVSQIGLLQTEILKTREQLRAVKLALKKDILAIQNIIKTYNIFGMSFIISIFAIIYAIIRRRRIKKRPLTQKYKNL